MLEGRIEIKVCGITEFTEAKALKSLKVDYAGFIFAESPRKISFRKARELALVMGNTIRKVGVFTEIDTGMVNDLYKAGLIDILQLHNDNFADISNILAPVWISVGIGDDGEFPSDGKYGFAEGIHLDTYDKKMKGGTGRSFNWSKARDFKTEKKLILAGGLNHNNIKEALGNVKADVVDLNSGAEVFVNGKRYKDPELIKKFIRKVRDYEEQR